MLKYPLYEFIATAPSCVETTALKMVLGIFEQEQCDHLVVLNEQQCPIGLVYSGRLLTTLLAANKAEHEGGGLIDLQEPLAKCHSTLVEPVKTLPATWSIEQLNWFVRSQQNQNHTNLDWVLVDSKGKFLGLVDSLRLLKFLAKQKVKVQPQESKPSHLHSGADNSTKDSSWMASPKVKSRRRKLATDRATLPEVVGAPAMVEEKSTVMESQAPLHQPLVQLLERLPWPLMLQTGNGEVVTQNPAWWQQLGVLKDPEGVRQQVEAILTPTVVKKPEYPTTKVVNSISVQRNDSCYQAQPTPIQVLASENDLLNDNTVTLPTGVPLRSKLTTPEPNPFPNLPAQPSTLREAADTSTTNRCFLDSQQGTCTCVVEVQNGQERVWQFAKIPLDSPDLKTKSSESGMVTSTDLWLMLATDVTEQQQLSKELAAKNADLIQLNRLKDEFLACISHELKTPLTAVLGLSRLLVDQQLGKLNERQARYAGLIHQSGRHLMSVVNDILDLTRMESGQMELMLAGVSIRTVCDRALSEAKAMHTQNRKTTIASPAPTVVKEHQFTLSIEPGLEEIVADEFRLRQMLVHLLSNAFKFTETGGDIGVRVNRWEGWIAFTVWDTGIGIPEHQQHLIFQKFQQLENPLTRQFEGTGLGLVLTRALARLHGGDVSFLSREGQGSQFTLLLPPTPPHKIGAGEDSHEIATESSYYSPPSLNSLAPTSNSHSLVSTSPTNRNSLVLIVEAVARYIEDLTELLTALGYRVVIARSGCEAVEKARRLQPKAIFLNPLLPLLSGWDVLTLLKSDVATRSIPVIVTATAAEKEQAFANRADGFLSLPVQHQVLAPLLESLCAIPEPKLQNAIKETTVEHTPLRILRLVNHQGDTLNLHPFLQQHRVIEVDDIEQAELLARVWQFDVVLLDAEMPTAEACLQKLKANPRLASLPLVTCDVATTQAASQVTGLSVFPCLTQNNTDNSNNDKQVDALLSVLQIAASICCPPSILVVDLAILPDLPDAKYKRGARADGVRCAKSTSLGELTVDENTPFPSQNLKSSTISRGSEWFQALIQYLQTAGLKAAIGRSWAELLQQLRHESVDLLLICLRETKMPKEVFSALRALEQLPFQLPPVLVLDQRRNPDICHEGSLENVVGAIASEILPRSISMEDLLKHINQALSVKVE
ncbi:ATP-binding protein [Chlorogloeopsis sp. ULAP02]|uniref:ATP-binding response regulator n=1 Tax=Chlorogloeopsis sp. ULAP02 TaxID=3107926 RepID=UPI003136F89C